jgi:6-phosphogluconate dehydrogenase (decarboxylating)
MRKNGVKSPLMGGQACGFYRAAEFSRDVDLPVLAEPANIGRLVEFWLRELRTPDLPAKAELDRIRRAGGAGMP